MVLRSGGANGADMAFEEGCDAVSGNKAIYLPWKGFNDNNSELYEVDKLALGVAEYVYGIERWKLIKPSVKNLMARNIYQITGNKLINPTYSKFVVCYTPDGCENDKSRTRKTGGTGQAISLASMLDIPVFNLKNDDALSRINNEIEIINLFGD